MPHAMVEGQEALVGRTRARGSVLGLGGSGCTTLGLSGRGLALGGFFLAVRHLDLVTIHVRTMFDNNV